MNLLDAPGHPDFVGELRAGIRAADAAIFVISAADGIDGAAQALWDECTAANCRGSSRSPSWTPATPTSTTPSPMPKPNSARASCHHTCPPSAPGVIAGNIGLLSLEEHDYSGGDVVNRKLTADDSHVETYRGPLIEAIIQEAEDDGLMDRYLEARSSTSTTCSTT